MTLAGRPLALALVGASLLGVVAGVSVEGWRKVRGLPPIEVTTDAGVRLEVDAGTLARSDCAASVEHWNTISVPGPIRYVYVDGGTVQLPPEVVTVLVPDIRLTGSAGASAGLQSDGQATASASARVDASVAPERHWEAGPSFLYGFKSQDVLWGAQAGWSGGPFDIRAQVLKGPGDVYAGVMLGWRW